MILGCHLSIAGGVHRALERAADLKLDALAMFVRNQRQWKAPPLSADEAELFRQTRQNLHIGPIVAHASYLINLAGEKLVRGRSMAAMADELDRARRLGIDAYVFHPGSCSDTELGIARIAEALNSLADVPERQGEPMPRILMETTAGQGNSIGCRPDHLAGIFERLEKPQRFGVCLDSCHVFAAGWDIRTPAGYARMWDDWGELLAPTRLLAIHLNDSLKVADSHVDRHAHIGEGEIGAKGLARLINDERLSAVPFILETPKGETDDGEDFDAVNARAARKLEKRPRR
jgi:deoxyribonuclease-4